MRASLHRPPSSPIRLGAVATGILLAGLFAPDPGASFPLSRAAWSDQEWTTRCRDVRTTYNPSGSLSTEALTITLENPRFLDFVHWVWANKIIEHQVEQVGGTEWNGPTEGVIFHWAPGSRWETHTVVPFEHAIHHIAGEHRWTDSMFKEFFEPFGPITGANIGARLSASTPPTWADFLGHIGGPESPYYRYVFHQETSVDPSRRVVIMSGGQGVLFEYTFDRYLAEVKEVLTDCKTYQFFQLYDRYGQGFASKAGWAGQSVPAQAERIEKPTNGTVTGAPSP